ncbi:MAG TPA: hypothetical protein VIW03_09090, partial [Anaeromyxobacter sp.]
TAPETAPTAPQGAQVRGDGVRSVWTLAGSPFVEGLQDGPGDQARFRRPTAAAIDASGNVLVADTGNHAVRMMKNDAAHTVVTLAGNGTAGDALGDGASARLNTPTGIAVAQDGTIYVSDTGNQRILRLRPEGAGYAVERLAGGEGWLGFADGDGASARFSNPGGLALSGGRLYVADRQNNAIRRVDASTGRTDTLAGGGGQGSGDGARSSGKFSFPGDLALAGDALLVVDAGNRGIRRVSIGTGAVSTVAGAGGGSFDSGGYADGAASDARFMAAGGILADGGDVLVADGGNACVRRIQGGRVSTVAGTGLFGSRDGAAADARFAVPTALVRLGAGEWLVVDHGASTLRRLSATDAPPAVDPPPVDPPPPPPPAGAPGGGCGCDSGSGAGVLALVVASGLVGRLRRARSSRNASPRAP